VENSDFLPIYVVQGRNRAQRFVWEADSEDHISKHKQVEVEEINLTSFIHDMESFFWVLLYIFLTRKGPGVDSVREE